MNRHRYQKSEQLLERAQRTIPLGSQTFSKSKTQLPYGVSPFFASHAQGAYIWDVDGNKYIDFINSLLAVTLGYNDPDVTAAVKSQLEKGTIFSLTSELEFMVAEKICKMVPCAEKVRFGKNGSDATAGAVRIARAYTGRDHILVCGYHGWQDWYIGSTSRHLGVPIATRELTHTFQYNNINSLKQWFDQLKGEVAAVILEPVNSTPPTNNFLVEVKEITHKEGAVLIFDETITGFRLAMGGAQEFFGVIPDLATLGKGLANGYPLSAVAGRSDIMKLMEAVFFSFTFGGETLSLAAALVTLNKLSSESVIEKLWKTGEKIISGLEKLINQYELGEIFSVSGLAPWTFFNIKDASTYTSWQLKTLLLQEMFKRGILLLGTHNISYAHSDKDISALLEAYSEYFDIVNECINKKNLQRHLNCQVLEPLFQVR